ncbi:MAG: SpoIIE family protein phosphatase, partial [Candidatus Bipolaricaulota bacterium]
LFLLRNGSLAQLTDDHTIVREMVLHGIIPADRARSHPEAGKLSRAIGLEKGFRVDVRAEGVPLSPGDVLLLCSDGLTDVVPDREIELALLHPAAAAARRLIALARDRGAPDNVTAAVWQLGPPRRHRFRRWSLHGVRSWWVLVVLFLGILVLGGLGWQALQWGREDPPRPRTVLRRADIEPRTDAETAPGASPDVIQRALAAEIGGAKTPPPETQVPTDCEPAAFALMTNQSVREILLDVYHGLEDGRESVREEDRVGARLHVRAARAGLDEASRQIRNDATIASLVELCDLEWTFLRSEVLELHYQIVLRQGEGCASVGEEVEAMRSDLGVVPDQFPDDVKTVVDSCFPPGGGVR